MASPADWYSSLPPVTKAWGTACLAATVASSLGILSPKLLYLDYGLVARGFQIWRPVTCFLFLGNFGIKFAMNLLLLARHGVQLESNTFQGRTADFLYMLLFGMGTMLAAKVVAPDAVLPLPFLAASLVFMVLYLWCRENPNANVNIMGLVTLQAFYLPWAYLVLDILFGADPRQDLLGILVGHLYFFLTTIYPHQGGRDLLKTPQWVHQLVAKWGVAGPQVQFQAAPPAWGQRAAAASAPPQPATTSSAFRGRAYRLDRD